jgi:hypothetical protein
MNIVLRHAASRYYYAGPGYWVQGPEDAVNLDTIEGAGDAAKRESFGGLEIVAYFGDPDCELVLPVSRKATGIFKAPPARAQAVARPPPPDFARGTAPLPWAPPAPGLT